VDCDPQDPRQKHDGHARLSDGIWQRFHEASLDEELSREASRRLRALAQADRIEQLGESGFGT
jgi:hypothetical protein